MDAWAKFVEAQESVLGKEIVDQWLRPLRVVHFDAGNLYLEAKDSFQVNWFEQHLRPHLKKQLLSPNFRPIKVHLTVEEGASYPKPSKEKPQKGSSPPLTFPTDPIEEMATMERFLAGKQNAPLYRFFCELTGYKLTTPQIALGTFNPIYIWGPSGCGKTHLLMATAQAMRARGLNALYARTETFTEHVVAAIRASSMQSFRHAYRHVDLLLLDDVHLLSRRNATQEELFHTFNALHGSGKQILLSANCPPSGLIDIEPRLVSRFEWGITLPFEKLGKEDLKTLLSQQIASLGLPISAEGQDFLASTFNSAKALQNALSALALRSHMQGKTGTFDPDAIERMLSDLIEKEVKEVVTAEKIVHFVAGAYGIRHEDILGKSQKQECSTPRQVAMYLCREQLQLPFQAISQVFNRDRSTVMTSIKQIQKKIESQDRELLSVLAEIGTRF
ncbi:MAG: ATP-binding protein [Verrucomicrobia bacterium]|nr:ATP-binding protein [Verrucomicrobiota bacterium]